VPSSYNELYPNVTYRNHLGWKWYSRDFHISNYFLNENNVITLRIASCHYYCMVWLNNKKLGFHESGHLPFEFDITDIVLSSNNNKKFHLVIAVNNTLNLNTIPPAGFFHGDDIKYSKYFFYCT
jgi:beta-glucuronidase